MVKSTTQTGLTVSTYWSAMTILTLYSVNHMGGLDFV